MKVLVIGTIFIIVLFFGLTFRNDTSIDLCKGSAKCFQGKVIKVVDGDTLEIGDETIRLSLVNTPEKDEDGYYDAKLFSERLCLNSSAIVDEDDKQISRSHRRIVGVVYCNGKNLNQELLENGHAFILEDFCNRSEFSNDEWAETNGC